jgi:Fe-S-cluster-containing dehydrogenase component
MKEEEKDKNKNEISRRSFLASAGIVAAGSVIGGGMLAGCSSEPAEETVSVTETRTRTTTVQVEVPVVRQKAMGHLIQNPDICSGCRTCELVCAINKEGVASAELSRIQWTKQIFGGQITDILPCQHCDEPECLQACPTGALHIDANTGARVIDADICVGCQLCLNACPFNPPRIRFNVNKHICFKCDLCDGEPLCVKFCPTGALSFVMEDM